MVGHAGVLALPLGRRRPHLLWLGAAGCALLLAVLALASPLAALWAKALVDPFFHGTSAGAAVSVLLFTAVGCLRMAWDTALAPRAPSPWLLAVLPAAVLLGQLTNVLSHLWLMQQFELPMTAAIHHWSGAHNTYSWLFHSHTGKAALDLLAAGLLDRWAPSWDIGHALGASLPWAVGALSAASLVTGLLCTLMLWPSVVHRWGQAGGLLFAFCALSCLKTAVDGGPLTYRFLPAAAVLTLMLLGLAGCGVRARTRSFRVLAALTAGYLALWWTCSPEPGASALSGLAVTLVILGGLGLATSAAVHRVAAWPRRVGALACAAVVAVSVAASVLGTPVALLLPLDKGMQATVCATGPCRTFNVDGRTAFDVYREAGDDVLKPRHTFIAPAALALPDSNRLLVAVRALRTVQPSAADAPEGTGVAALPLRPVAGTSNVLVALSGQGVPAVFGTAAHAFGNRNYHVFLHRAAAALRGQGLVDFVLSPVRDPADALALGVD